LVVRRARAGRREHSQNWRALAWGYSPGYASYGIVSGGTSPFRYVEGQNVTIELRYAEAGLKQLPDLAADLIRAKVDVIATFGDLATKTTQPLTSTIPIVTLTDDALGSGLISGLSRHGGNTTGISILAAELGAKRLELLSMMVPGLSRVACLWDPTSGASQVATTENAARTMRLKLQILEVGHRDDVEGAFRAARDGQAQALNVLSSPFLASIYREIIDHAAGYRLPAIYQWRELTEAGGLMSYGPSLPAMWGTNRRIGGESPEGRAALRSSCRTTN
jgi:putative tryptophan/tyrosine transport system substrate-binding protein